MAQSLLSISEGFNEQNCIKGSDIAGNARGSFADWSRRRKALRASRIQSYRHSSRASL